MDPRVIISNIAAAAILIIFSVALVLGVVPDSSEGIAFLMVGSSLTYLFTEDIVNGKLKKPV